MLRLDESTVESYAAELDAEKESLNELVQRINSTVQRCADAWEGVASQAYQEQWTDLYPTISKVEEVIQTLAQQLRTASGDHADVEQALKKMIGY